MFEDTAVHLRAESDRKDRCTNLPAELPAIEVHLSDVEDREEWRRHSVIAELCIARVAGKGPPGYREALERLQTELSST